MSNNNRASLLKQHMAMTNTRISTTNTISSTPSFDRNSSVSRLAQSASRALKARQTISFIQKQQLQQQQYKMKGTEKVMNTISSSGSSDSGASSSGSSSYESREESVARENNDTAIVTKYSLNHTEMEEHYTATTVSKPVDECRDGPVVTTTSTNSESIYEPEREDAYDGVGCSYSEVESSSSGETGSSGSSVEEIQVEKQTTPIILQGNNQSSTSLSIMKIDTSTPTNCVSPRCGDDHSNITSPPTPVATNRSSSSALTAVVSNNTPIVLKRSTSNENIIQEETTTPSPVESQEEQPIEPTPPTVIKLQDQKAQEQYNKHPPLSEGSTFKKFEYKLSMPGQKIKDLLTVIAIKPTGPRKMNACGALKTLSSIPANRIRLSWTRGVIPTLSSVLNDDTASIIEKQRCVSTLLNLIQPKINQVIILHSPSFVQGISNGLLSTCYKTKYISSQCIDILAKNDDNKHVMFDQFPLMNAIAVVISSAIPPTVDDTIESPEDNNVSKADFHGLALSARLRCLLTLRHLSRVKEIAFKFARNIQTMTTLLSVSGKMDQSANAVCIAIFADLTRHSDNSLQLVYHVSGFVKALVDAAKESNTDDPKCRQYACYAMQNLSCNMGCRQELAITNDLLSTLAECVLHFNYPEEQIAAIGALVNISNDPSNFIHLSNTTTCFKALVLLANESTYASNDVKHKEMLQYLACDALATLSNWIAASALAGMNASKADENNGIVFTKEMMRPKLFVQPWDQWD